MSRHAYPTSAMLGDYVRAVAGLFPTVAVLTIVPMGVAGATVLGGVAVLFAAFAIQTALRHGTHLELKDGALRASGPLQTSSIRLGELDRLKLLYFSTRRDGRGGWMQLELRSGSSTLRVDGRIEGFAELVEASARAAKRRGLSLNPATLANLQALEVELRSPQPGFQQAAGAAR
jgi:hypothetical protein